MNIDTAGLLDLASVRWKCQRKKSNSSADLIARGEAVIDKDPDYWADQTMGDLLDSLSGKKPS